MRKLNALRQYLIDAVPHLQRNPDQLLTFVEDGTIEFAPGLSLSHGYTFTAQIVLTDFADDIDTIMVPLLDWLGVYQPDLVPAEAIKFEAEILSNDAVDLALRVQLTERVVAKRDCGTGQIHAHHRIPRFDTEQCPGEHWQLLIRDDVAGGKYELVAEWDGPAGGAHG